MGGVAGERFPTTGTAVSPLRFDREAGFSSSPFRGSADGSELDR